MGDMSISNALILCGVVMFVCGIPPVWPWLTDLGLVTAIAGGFAKIKEITK